MTMHHDHGHGGTTVVEDRSGPSAAVMALLAIVIIGVLIWLFAFSGVVFDNEGDTGPTLNQEQNFEEDTGDTGTTTDTESDTGTESSP
jgi:hypothetical protein